MNINVSFCIILAVGSLLSLICNVHTQANSINYNRDQDLKMEHYRLPEGIKPIAYDLYLYPNLKTETFSGEVTIDVELKDDHKSIMMHNNGLTIKKTLIDNVDAVHSIDSKYETLQINLPKFDTLSMGKKRITIEFDGDLKNRYVGFYSSKYLNERGTKT